MKIIKYTRRSLWALISVSVLLALVQFFHIQHFLTVSTKTEALVMKMSNSLPGTKATIRFVTDNQTVLDTEVMTLDQLAVGKKLQILYNPVIPAQARVDDFIDTWFDIIVYAAVFIFSFLILFLIQYLSSWRERRLRKLRMEGHRILTRFKKVEAVLKAEKDGKCPFRIVSTWRDPKSKKTYEFRSGYLWKNPEDYIMDQTIQIVLDVKNKRKYMMDLSFLPDNLQE